jgi:flagellar motor protein MotB
MTEPHKKIRHSRIEKSESHPIADESSHLWAVSYADLLMVLLSFFIIFFSVDQSKRKSLVQKIASATEATNEVRTLASAGSHLNIRTLMPKIAEAKISVQQNGETLRIEFPNNVFKKGQSDLPEFEKKRLAQILKTLRPFQEQIELVFIGHSDPAPVKRAKSRNLRDNYDLSAIRASRALNLASTMGFDPKVMRTSGAAQYDRPSRTLTIEVLQRGEESL